MLFINQGGLRVSMWLLHRTNVDPIPFVEKTKDRKRDRRGNRPVSADTANREGNDLEEEGERQRKVSKLEDAPESDLDQSRLPLPEQDESANNEGGGPTE